MLDAYEYSRNLPGHPENPREQVVDWCPICGMEVYYKEQVYDTDEGLVHLECVEEEEKDRYNKVVAGQEGG